MGSVLDLLDEALDALALAELDDDEAVVRLHQQLARLDAIRCSVVFRWDVAGGWRVTTARDAAAWLETRCRVSRAEARRTLRLGRAMRTMPAAEAAWHAGMIDRDHVSALGRLRGIDGFAADEALLVELAKELRHSHFQRKLQYWRLEHDVDRPDPRDVRQCDISTTFQGNVVGDFTLDPISGAIVTGEHRRIEHAMFEHDWRQAREELGRDPLVHELARTPKQRRADALVEMAIRSATPDKKGQRPAPLFSVFVDHETIHELASGVVIDPDSLVPWFLAAQVERVVFDTPSRVIDVGETRRLFTGATRKAVIYASRECEDDYCDEPAANCQADHIHPHAWGGLTLRTNGRPLCGHHNRHRPRGP